MVLLSKTQESWVDPGQTESSESLVTSLVPWITNTAHQTSP